MKEEISLMQHVRVLDDHRALGDAAATEIAHELRRLIAVQGEVRMIFAAAPSQSDMLAGLVAAIDTDWSRVTAFHINEYLGLPADVPERFARWLSDALFDRLPFGRIHLIKLDRDPKATAAAYAKLLSEDPIDLVDLGIGQNGHLAFNDPPVADFENPLDVKVVELELACRQQQVDDRWFANLADVPHRAITLTMPRLLSSRRLFCVVPGQLRRRAARRALIAPISLANPATALRTHPGCTLNLDAESAPLSDRHTPRYGEIPLVDETFRWYFENVSGILTKDRGLGEVSNRTRANASRIPASHHARDNLHDLGGVGIDGNVPVCDETTATLFGRSRGPVRSR